MSERDRRIELSQREIQKLEILNEVRAGGRTQVSAAQALGVSDRWVRSLLSRLERRGARSLVHGNRGRRSFHRIPDAARERIASLYRTKYAEFNLNHFSDMLQEREGLVPPCREMLRRILSTAGLWSARRKAANPARIRRGTAPGGRFPALLAGGGPETGLHRGSGG
jgi:transposase